jgi:integrase
LRKDGHLTTSGLDRAVSRYEKALGNHNSMPWGPWRPHDLHRTVRTRLAAARVTEEVAEAVVGHSKKGIVSVYNQHQYSEEKRRALRTWERHLRRIIEGKTEEKVVNLRGKR